MAQLSADKKTYYFRVLLYGGASAGKATTLVGLRKMFNPQDNAAINKKILGKDALITLRVPLPGNKFQEKDIVFLLHTFSGQCQDLKNWELASDGIDGLVQVVDCHKTLRQIILGNNLANQLMTKKNLVNLPRIYMYNKRDKSSISLQDLQQNINQGNLPYFECQATAGKGIGDMFKKFANIVIQNTAKNLLVSAQTKSSSSTVPEGIEVVSKELEVWDPKEAEKFFSEMDQKKESEPEKESGTSVIERQAQEEAARKLAEEEAARKLAEEETARKLAEEEAARKAAEEEAARKASEEEAARKLAEEAARKLAEEEAARKLAEEEVARKLAEEEVARKLAEEEAARKLAEEEAARKLAEEAARKAAEEEAARKAAEEEAARKAAEEEMARKLAEEEARKADEEEAIRMAAEEARKAAAEAAAEIAAEAAMKAAAEAEAEATAEAATKKAAEESHTQQSSSEPSAPSDTPPSSDEGQKENTGGFWNS